MYDDKEMLRQIKGINDKYNNLNKLLRMFIHGTMSVKILMLQIHTTINVQKMRHLWQLSWHSTLQITSDFFMKTRKLLHL